MGGDPWPDQFLISLLFRRMRGLARWGLASSLRRLAVFAAVDAFQCKSMQISILIFASLKRMSRRIRLFSVEKERALKDGILDF